MHKLQKCFQQIICSKTWHSYNLIRSQTYRSVKDMPGVGNGLLERWTFSALTSYVETDTNDLQAKLRCKCQQFTDLLQSRSKLWAEFSGGFWIIHGYAEYQSIEGDSRGLCEYRLSPSNIKTHVLYLLCPTYLALEWQREILISSSSLSKVIVFTPWAQAYLMCDTGFVVCA